MMSEAFQCYWVKQVTARYGDQTKLRVQYYMQGLTSDLYRNKNNKLILFQMSCELIQGMSVFVKDDNTFTK